MKLHRSGTCHFATRSPRNAAELGRVDRGAVLHDDARERAFLPARVGHADDARLDDGRVRHQVVLELHRADPLAARLDDVLGPVGDLDVPFGVHRADVTGTQPTVVELLGRVVVGSTRP